MAVESGANERAFVKLESSFGTLPTPAATDAIRHLNLTINAKNNREVNPTKRGTPDYAGSLPRRKSAQWNLADALWEPSGVLGTASYLGVMLKAAFGTQTLPNLNTTVAASPSPSATGCTLISGAGLAVGDLGVFNVGSAREVTRLKTVAGAAVTYDALSAAPAQPGKFISGVNYKQATSLTQSLGIFLFHTGGSFKQALSGGVVNRVRIIFDGTKEVHIEMSGFGKTVVRTGFSEPGSHTTTGEPASGLVGNFNIDGVATLIQTAAFTMENNLGPRNTELGTSTASGFFRENRRRTTVELGVYLEDTVIFDTAEAITNDVLRLLVGDTDGAMLAAVAPKVEWEIPDVPSTDGPKTITVNGNCYSESAGNTDLFIAEL